MLKLATRIVSAINLGGSLATIMPWLPLILTTAISTVWAYIYQLPGLAVFLIGLFCLMSTIWTGIGIVWLAENKRKQKLLMAIPEYDCSYGLSIFFLDVLKSDIEEVHLQVRLQIANSMDFPLKYHVRKRFVRLGNSVPIDDVKHPEGFLQRRNGNTIWRLSPFPKHAIPIGNTLHGIIEMEVDYGHPQLGFSRTRVIHLELRVEYRAMLDQPDAGIIKVLQLESNGSASPLPSTVTVIYEDDRSLVS